MRTPHENGAMALDVVPAPHVDAPQASSTFMSPNPGHGHLLNQFNQAVRQPAQFGGLAVLPRLLDRLAQGEGQTAQTVWIPDTNARLSPSALVREYFPDPAIHVVASQYGEDAFRRGWLHLDRTMNSSEFDRLVGSVLTWSKTDRTIHDVIAEYGPASITFGDTDPRCPKTLGYASTDCNAPFVVFHFATAQVISDPHPNDQEQSAAVLLAVRTRDDFFKGWQFTPWGEQVEDVGD